MAKAVKTKNAALNFASGLTLRRVAVRGASNPLDGIATECGQRRCKLDNSGAM